MRMFRYEDLDGTHIISEAKIVETYWDYWSGRMINQYGKDSPLITKEKCIEDFCVIHWAWEIKDEDIKKKIRT